MASAADHDTDREELRGIYRRMLVGAGVGAALAVLLHVLWQDARGPAAWIAVAGGTALWGVVETAEVRLSLGRAMLLFEAGLVCFALAGMLLMVLGNWCCWWRGAAGCMRS